MTKNDCTGNNQNFNSDSISEKAKQNKIIELLDYGIGGLKLVEVSYTVQNNTDISPRHFCNGLSGMIDYVLQARELLEKLD